MKSISRKFPEIDFYVPEGITWEKISLKLSKMNLFKPKNRMFYRLFHQGAKLISLDKTGRILIPSSQMERVGLNQEAMLIASTT